MAAKSRRPTQPTHTAGDGRPQRHTCARRYASNARCMAVWQAGLTRYKPRGPHPRWSASPPSPVQIDVPPCCQPCSANQRLRGCDRGASGGVPPPPEHAKRGVEKKRSAVGAKEKPPAGTPGTCCEPPDHQEVRLSRRPPADAREQTCSLVCLESRGATPGGNALACIPASVSTPPLIPCQSALRRGICPRGRAPWLPSWH